MSAQVSMDEVVSLCRKRAPKGIGSWAETTLRQYLTTRHDRGEMALVAYGPFVTALGVAEEKPDGAIEIVAVIGHRRLFPLLWRQLCTRWADWRTRRFQATRRGKPVTYTLSQLGRIIGIA